MGGGASEIWMQCPHVTVPAVTDTPQGRVVWEGQMASSLLSLQLLCKPQLVSKYVFVVKKQDRTKQLFGLVRALATLEGGEPSIGDSGWRSWAAGE